MNSVFSIMGTIFYALSLALLGRLQPVLILILCHSLRLRRLAMQAPAGACNTDQSDGSLCQ